MRGLDLTGNDIGDAGFAALAGSSYLSEVRVLKLGRNQITDDGVRDLAKASRPAFPAALARPRGESADELRRGPSQEGLRPSCTVKLDLAGTSRRPRGPRQFQSARSCRSVLRDVAEAAEAAELRRRVAHPRMRPGDRPNPTG